jgi:peptide/nickel transport system ATP-binding protein
VQAQVLSLLQALQQRLHVAMIFITHDLRVAAQVCHRIAVMHKGNIVEIGTPQQILDNPQHEYTQRLIGAIPGRDWNPALAAADS